RKKMGGGGGGGRARHRDVETARTNGAEREASVVLRLVCARDDNLVIARVAVAKDGDGSGRAIAGDARDPLGAVAALPPGPITFGGVVDRVHGFAQRGDEFNALVRIRER